MMLQAEKSMNKKIPFCKSVLLSQADNLALDDSNE